VVPTDDQLDDLLGSALDEAPAEPPADRIAALRARAEAARPRADELAARRTRPPGRFLLAAAAALVALAVGFVAGRALDGDDGETAGDVEYDGPMSAPGEGEADATLSVVRTGIGRVIELDTDVLPILPTGEYYEIWFVAPGDSPDAPDRISAGTFHPDPDGRSNVRFAAAVDPAKYPHVVITAEPGDGNPAPTGPEVLRATIG
jgi:hypothetical protein